MERKLHEFYQFLRKMRNSFVLITDQYQCFHISPNYWRGWCTAVFSWRGDLQLTLHLLQHKIHYEKQFGFQASNSMEHAFIQLINQILDAFNKNKYTKGILIVLSKAFDTVDHDILLKKLDIYGIKCYFTAI